eukprot:1334820-Amorphochlora_amoeboformis.AAC.1
MPIHRYVKENSPKYTKPETLFGRGILMREKTEVTRQMHYVAPPEIGGSVGDWVGAGVGFVSSPIKF